MWDYSWVSGELDRATESSGQINRLLSARRSSCGRVDTILCEMPQFSEPFVKP